MNYFLELFLITYNRKEKLRQTLQTILAENSPVRDLPLTILDNCSTDGTSEMLQQIALQHPTIKYIRHNKNIGGNANIARAFEMARAEYVWVLCDDDEYNFEAWPQCYQILQQRPPAVVVATYAHPQKGPAYLFRQLSFVPAAIYRTDLITGDVLTNLYFNVSNMFPQLAVAAAAMNQTPHLPIVTTPLVTMKLSPNNDSFTRGVSDKQCHPLMKEMFWSLGYLRSIQMLTSKRLRRKCSQLVWSEEYTSFNYFCKRWRAITNNRFLLSYFEGLHLLHGKAKWKFAFLVPASYLIFFYYNERGVYVCLLGRLKTKLWPTFKLKNN